MLFRVILPCLPLLLQGFDGVELLQMGTSTGICNFPELEPPKPAEFPSPKKILVFWAVGSNQGCVTQLVQMNSKHFRDFQSASKNVTFDIFLAHYDLNKAAWQSELGAWYDENVKYSSETTGLKFWLAKELLAAESSSLDVRDYDWLWFLDEDGDFTKMDLGALIGDAEDSGALIVAPSITFSRPVIMFLGCEKGEGKCGFQAPHDCRFRHVNFVEVSFPLLRPEAFLRLAEAPLAVNEDSVWGLDHVWCSLAPELMGWGNGTKSGCAILDRASIIHRNFRTMPKWKDKSQWAVGTRAMARAEKAFPGHFVSDRMVETYLCAK